MEEASIFSKRRFTIKMRKHWIRGNNNELSQGFLYRLVINLGKSWYICQSKNFSKNKTFASEKFYFVKFIIVTNINIL